MKELTISGILKFAVTAALLFFAFAALVTFVGTLRWNYLKNSVDRNEDTAFLRMTCKDRNVASRQGLGSRCEEKKTEVTKGVLEWAFYGTFQSWGFCGAEGCFERFSFLGSPLEWMLTMLVVVASGLVLVLLVGCSRAKPTTLLVPHYVEATPAQNDARRPRGDFADLSWSPGDGDGARSDNVLGALAKRLAPRVFDRDKEKFL